MTQEAYVHQDGADVLDFTPVAAVSAGQIIQLPDGRAGIVNTDLAASQKGSVRVSGIVTVTKTAGIVILDGGRVAWDYSANAAHFKTVNDRDLFIGAAFGDAASADTTMKVLLNVEPRYLIDMARDPATTVTVGTAAAEGFGRPKRIGGTTKFLLTATNEAQKVDIISNQAFAVGANAIVEARFNVISDGAGAAVDASIGVANATHATDADAITESLFVHLDANDANINIESDDGTTEVGATDSTVDYAEGTPVEVWFDMRDEADIQVYINGVNVLPATAFKLNAATGPLKLLTHIEKTASTDTYELDIDWLRARISGE